MYFVILFSSSWQSGWIIFHNSNSNRLIYSGVLQSSQFSLFLMAVLAYSVYSKIAQSSPPWFQKCPFDMRSVYTIEVYQGNKASFLAAPSIHAYQKSIPITLQTKTRRHRQRRFRGVASLKFKARMCGTG